MTRLFKKLAGKAHFEPAVFTETLVNLCNPCRGWYQMFCFLIEKEPDFQPIDRLPDYEDSMVQLVIDIGALKKENLQEIHFNRIDKIIRHFREKGKDIILRIVYDHVGKAAESEPPFFAQVTSHAEQVAQILARFPDEIFIYQGLLVGNWGEMHSSRFVDDERFRQLVAIIEKGRSREQFLAVRRPVQWRAIRRLNIDGSDPKPKNIGLFNDGLFGSENDLGTYGKGSRQENGWSHAWGREAELDFQDHLCSVVPNGGEALYDEEFISNSDAARFISELSRMHVTYLNREHDVRLIEYWRSMTYEGRDVWNGNSLFSYIGAHLGYRFMVTKAEIAKTKSGEYRLDITIENLGFAKIYKACVLQLEYEGREGKKTVQLDCDLRNCKAGESSTVSVTFAPSNGNIFLSANIISDGKPVLFANTDVIDGRVRLGRFIL